MAQITTVGTIDVGIFINPNTFTRQIAKSYEILGNRINLLSIIFTSGQRAPVRPSDVRWSWNTPSSFGVNGAINDSSIGLDGTTIYAYAGADYLLKNPLFLKINPDLVTQKRPATIYESFLNMIDYLDSQLATRYSSVLAAAAASTGDITFSGIKIIGAGTAGENNYGTIELVPDSNRYVHEQYLVIDPTAPDHIHIRPGGIADESIAKLILGAELTNVTVSDNEGQHVKIHSRNVTNDDSHIWAFSEDGTTAFPALTVNLHNGGQETAEVLKFAGTSTQCVITGPTPGIDIDAQRIIIQGQRGTGTGEGGDVYLWGGDSQVDGGDIKIYAGDADSLVGGVEPNLHDGGYVYLRGGTGFDTGGKVKLIGGSSSGGIGGNIELSAGNGTSAAGEVIIESNSNTWTFNSNGYMNVPANKDLLNDGDGSSLTGGGNRVASYNANGTNIQLTDVANIILIDTDPDVLTITLPDSSETYIKVGYEITVADITGFAATNNITILAGASDSIVGASSGVAIDTNYGLLSLKYVGSQIWLIMYGR